MLELLSGIIIFIVILLLIGALIALPALLPPIRKLGQRSQTVRVTAILVLGLVSFLVSIGLLTRVAAEVTCIFYTLPFHNNNDYVLTEPGPMGQEQRNRRAAVNELWVRNIMPPPLRYTCYTGDPFGCDLADKMVTSPTWGGYLLLIGMGLVSTSGCSALVWRFTRRRSPKQVEVKPIIEQL